MILDCPHCRKRLIQRSATGQPLIRTRLLLLEKGALRVQCRHCRAEVEIEAHLSKQLMKALWPLSDDSAQVVLPRIIA